jgi:hypothetical protein
LNVAYLLDVQVRAPPMSAKFGAYVCFAFRGEAYCVQGFSLSQM